MAKIIKSSDDRSVEYTVFERAALEIEKSEFDTGEEPEEEPWQDPRETIEEECRQILESTRAEAEAKVLEAYEEGLRRGEEAGRKAFLDAAGRAAETLSAAGEEMRAAREAFLTELEDRLIEVNRAVLARVLRRECQTDPSVMRRLLREVLLTLSGQERVKILVNPGDFDALNREAIGYLDEFDEIPRKEIVPDPGVESGGCMVETETLHVDASVQAQLDRILDAIDEPIAEDPGSAGGDDFDHPA
jgi:flagellar assembly protein FliH